MASVSTVPGEFVKVMSHEVAMEFNIAAICKMWEGGEIKKKELALDKEETF